MYEKVAPQLIVNTLSTEEKLIKLSLLTCVLENMQSDG